MKGATIFRDRVIALEDEHIGQPYGSFFEEIRCYTSACLLSAAASLEALINELYIAHNCRLRTRFADFEAEFWGKNGIEGKSILYKYQRALEMLGACRLDQRSSPYRDARALIEIRNALVHHHPTWDPERRRRIELIEVLADRFALSPFLDAGADFVSMKCMSAGCARWAVATAFSLIHEFDQRTNLDPGKMAGFWMLET
jgi:hypothetical protein